ncbi:response regulator [Sphingobacterium corticibacter]|uniref:histidine kinase n=1 Tax=Sphingobacterium corticibacter TaxID=2171749 RepID=A0A2T8HL70_9SPHI|nr:response regulator [Sphingobacterium corticibacter]PVH26140.1 hybrid sensor histidine kinase/response regulator [Sphingobacterium corticibacter]
MKKINLLILDDREENIISLRALLEELDDLHIIAHTDPNEALKVCWHEDITIAMVDVQMPKMNGFEFVSLLKSNQKTNHIMVIMVTAISKEERYLLEGLRSGAIDYLYKPLNPEITRAKVRSFIHQVRLQEEIKQKNIALEVSGKELLLAKEEAEHARKSKEIFLANMSHEIRTPINGIMSVIHVLKTSPLSHEQLEWLGILDNASQSLLVIINDILDLSRIDSGKFKIEMEDFSLTKFIDNMDRMFKVKADHKDLHFIVEKEGDLPDNVVFDALRLQQIVTNFISNSLKFTEQGSITFNVKLLDIGPKGYLIRFTVTDTGIGILTDHLPKIFQPFEQGDGAITKRYGGTGLGLAIVKQLAELLEGEVGSQSDVGVGSSFYFEAWFQKSKTEQAQKPNEPYINFPKLDDVQILVAEDNDLNAFMLAHMLKTWNCVVDIVKDGQQALDAVLQKTYDLVLMDTHMPVMSGFDAIKAIKALDDTQKNSMPIITISASVLAHEQAAAYEVGAQYVIVKPFDPVDLYSKITSVVGANKTVK